MNLLSLNRWKASAIHLAGSALIASIVLVLVLAVWYPPPYFFAMGGAVLLLLLIGVDVVIGPLITLIIFDPKKKSLKFDLSVIAALQFAALAYGSYIVFMARPVYNVFVIDRFELVAANQVNLASEEKAIPEFRSMPLTGPKIIAARKPDTSERQWDITMSALQGGDDLPQLPEFYVPYTQYVPAVGKAAKPLDVLEKRQPKHASEIRDFIRDTGRKADELGFLPMKARNNDMSVIVDVKTAAIVGILPIDPW
jgi:hypothetical protein